MEDPSSVEYSFRTGPINNINALTGQFWQVRGHTHMERVVSAKAQIRAKNEDRVTFVIEGQGPANVLLAVVVLFEELKVPIDAIWMVRHKRTGNPHITITVRPQQDGRQKIEDYLSKILGILSVKTQTGAKALIPNSPLDAE